VGWLEDLRRRLAADPAAVVGEIGLDALWVPPDLTPAQGEPRGGGVVVGALEGGHTQDKYMTLRS